MSVDEHNCVGRDTECDRCAQELDGRFQFLDGRVLPPILHEEWDKVNLLCFSFIFFLGSCIKVTYIIGTPAVFIFEVEFHALGRVMVVSCGSE